MSITSELTTAGPTVAASTKIQQTTVEPTTVQVYTSVPTTGNMHVIPSNASITLAVANTPTIQAVSTVFTSSLTNTCSDDEDTNFSCIVYEMKYGLCTATSGTLYRIAHKRCQAYCGICSGNRTSVPQQASLPTQPTCIDHDARCSQYQQQICSSTVSKNYVISTCPKSCNKCAEYLAQPVTTTAQPVTNTAPPVTTKAQQVTTTANPITTTPKPVTKTAAPTTKVQSVTTTTVVCQDKPGVDCKLFNIDFCANPYSNTICAKSCGHCTKVIQSAFG
ncbi:unnamed protein product [Mytilus edulis]|uniref:ShKT domain-containing protein n=1 Tax=Mytilus edulis TaxID=6550 RepID=A0A8S3UVC3_MYTED|nr:unnamed protein product [Mytilus edulis]